MFWLAKCFQFGVSFYKLSIGAVSWPTFPSYGIANCKRASPTWKLSLKWTCHSVLGHLRTVCSVRGRGYHPMTAGDYGLTLDLICALTSAPEVLKWKKVAIAIKTNAHHILHIVNFVYVRTMASGLWQHILTLPAAWCSLLENNTQNKTTIND